MKREEVIKVLKDGVYYDSIDVGDLIIKSDKYVYGYSGQMPRPVKGSGHLTSSSFLPYSAKNTMSFLALYMDEN